MRIIVGFAFALGLLIGLSLFLLAPHGTPQVVYAGGAPSGNGDVNASGDVDIADAVYLLSYLFASGAVPVAIECPECPACNSCCPPPSLPATGQTLCYDTAGNVDCASADYPGQDGFYQKGCSMANRFVDNGDWTVTDNCTGLMWQKTTPMGHTWQSALTYCENLDLGGHIDWRLPNVRELQSIVDYEGFENGTIDPVFGYFAWWCWSSTTAVGDPSQAWYVEFSGGSVGKAPKSFGSYDVRAVRDAR
jgi:hypothetical protein